MPVQLIDKLDVDKHDIEDPVESLPLPPRIHAVEPEASLREVVSLLKKHNIGCVLIAHQNQICGIFTERDYLRKVALESIDHNRAIKEFMTPNPVCVKRTDPVLKALLLMRKGRFRHLGIVDDQNRLHSVLSIKDIMEFLANRVSSLSLIDN